MRHFGLILILLTLPFLAAAQGRPAGVATQPVETRNMAETVSVFGEVVAGRQSTVAARVAGVAERVPLRVGDRVQSGDILAQLDTELLGIELAQAEAQIGIAEAGVAVAAARLDRAEKAYRRAETLRDNSTISTAQLEERQSDYAEALGSQGEAQARIKAAQTALRQARYRLNNATVRAPFDAVVLQVTTQVGQFISTGSQIATLVDLGALEVEANVPSRFITALGSDLSVAGRMEGGGMLALRLRAILPTEFSTTRTRPVRFEIAQQDAGIAVGQTVTLDVPVTTPREVLVVAKDALVQARGGWSVFVNEGGKAQQRTVEIGAALENGFEVLSGLKAGDEVVVRGNERLRPGQDIAPTNGPAADTTTPSGGAAAADEESQG